MLSFVFFVLAVAAGIAGFLLLAGTAQIGAWAVSLLLLALVAFSLVRKTDRPWRARQ